MVEHNDSIAGALTSKMRREQHIALKMLRAVLGFIIYTVFMSRNKIKCAHRIPKTRRISSQKVTSPLYPHRGFSVSLENEYLATTKYFRVFATLVGHIFIKQVFSWLSWVNSV